jgi:hypothetical protein
MNYWKKDIWRLGLVLMLLLPEGMRMQAQPVPSREYQLKAVFLFNFTQFVEWPPASFETSESPLIIGVLGENPFGAYLEQTVSDEKVNGHPVSVRYFDNEKEAQTSHILFINITETKKRKEAINALRGKNILTVSDAPDFTKLGGMIRFFNQVNKIKLQINLSASKESELVLSSKLLKLADIFEGAKTN